MQLLQPFRGRLVDQGLASQVVSPPYDSLTPEQRARYRQAQPFSFLHCLPVSTDLDEAELERCNTQLNRLLAEGAFQETWETPHFAVIRINDTTGTQTALVGEVPLRAVRQGRLLGHEDTMPARVEHLARHLEVTGVVSSPVNLTHLPHPPLDGTVAAVTRHPAALEFIASDGARMEVWLVSEPETVSTLSDALGELTSLYITDGHHRVAAALEVGKRDPDRPGSVLAAVVSSPQLDVRGFDRIVPYTDDIATALTTAGLRLRELDRPHRPLQGGQILITQGGRWWSAESPQPDRLDAEVVDRVIVAEMLGVSPALISHQAGIGDISELASDGNRVGLAVAPVDVETVFRLANRGERLPPKSTYFAPKMRSGVFLVQR